MTRGLHLLAALGLFALSEGCAGPKPFIRESSPSSVEISHAGDLQGATVLARQHCAAYEKVPRLMQSGTDVAIFDCVPP